MDRQTENSMAGSLERVQALAPGTDSLAKALKRSPCDGSEWEVSQQKTLSGLSGLQMEVGQGEGSRSMNDHQYPFGCHLTPQ